MGYVRRGYSPLVVVIFAVVGWWMPWTIDGAERSAASPGEKAQTSLFGIQAEGAKFADLIRDVTAKVAASGSFDPANPARRRPWK